VPLQLSIINEIAFAQRDCKLVDIRGAASPQDIHEMLGAFVMVARSPAARGIKDDLAPDRARSEKSPRDDIDAPAPVLLGIEHGLARPIDDADPLRLPSEIHIELFGVRHLGVKHHRALEGRERAAKTRRQKNDVRLGKPLVAGGMPKMSLTIEYLKPREVSRRHVDVDRTAGGKGQTIEDDPRAGKLSFVHETLEDCAGRDRLGRNRALVEGDRHLRWFLRGSFSRTVSAETARGKPIVAA
jgi:hypothetical protein